MHSPGSVDLRSHVGFIFPFLGREDLPAAFPGKNSKRARFELAKSHESGLFQARCCS